MSSPRFRLLRYYVWTSFLVTAFIGLVFGVRLVQEVRTDLLEKAKSHAVRVMRYLQDEIRLDFLEPLIESGETFDLEGNDRQYRALNTVVSRVARAFDILDVYIFDRDGRIVYSTRREHIGVITPSTNELFRRAIHGEIASEVRNRGTPLDISEGSGHPALLETYLPVRSIAEPSAGGGEISNVIEAYQDIEEFQIEVSQAQKRLVIATVTGGLSLFVCLFWIVLHADRLIRRQTGELVSSNDKLRRLSRELEGEVERRTKQLLQKEKLASLGTLAAGLAHEVNNPLASVSTCAQGMRSRIEEAERGKPLDLELLREYAELIVNESFRVKKITRNLLDFSRQQPGSASEPLDLRDLLAETVDLLRVGPDLDGVSVKLPSRSATIFGDATSFRQLSLNLMKNAIDAVRAQHELDGREGEIQWDIDSDEDVVVVSCRDNGVGFPPELAGDLIEPFHTTKEPRAGTGLGLALAHSMARRLDGELEIRSEGPGLGATVWLRFSNTEESTP